MTTRRIEVRLEKRGVSCKAELLEDLAPKTCDLLWEALPQCGDAFHAKYASNEVYTLVAPFAPKEPGLENPTMTPIAGDLVYFYFAPGMVALPDVKDTAYKTRDRRPGDLLRPRQFPCFPRPWGRPLDPGSARSPKTFPG